MLVLAGGLHDLVGGVALEQEGCDGELLGHGVHQLPQDLAVVRRELGGHRGPGRSGADDPGRRAAHVYEGELCVRLEREVHRVGECELRLLRSVHGHEDVPVHRYPPVLAVAGSRGAPAAALRLGGTASAARKLTRRAPAEMANAIVKPRSAGSPEAPTVAAMMLADTRPPIAPPIVRMIVFMPVATPVCSAGTASTIRFARAANARPMPAPRKTLAR